MSDNCTRLHGQVVPIAEAKAYHVARLGGRCACCGDATFEFLEVCPLDGSPTLSSGFDAPKAFYAFVDKYSPQEVGFQVLCSNCNYARGRYGDGVCPHQTGQAARHPIGDQSNLLARELSSATDDQLDELQMRIGQLQIARSWPTDISRMVSLLNSASAPRHTS